MPFPDYERVIKGFCEYCDNPPKHKITRMMQPSYVHIVCDECLIKEEAKHPQLLLGDFKLEDLIGEWK